MDNRQDTTVEALLEHLIEHGPDDIGTVFARAFELAMRIERERFLRASPYERTAARQGYANGYKPSASTRPRARSRSMLPRRPVTTVSRSTRNRWNAAAGRCAR